jgi:nitrogenase-associated protein
LIEIRRAFSPAIRAARRPAAAAFGIAGATSPVILEATTTRWTMAQVSFWEKPGCGGNARQKARLRASGHEVVEHDLLGEPWTAESLSAFLAGLPVAAWFNRAAPKVKSGEIVPEALAPEAALAALLAEPLLIRRPLMRVGDRRMVGFDETAVDAWIGLRPTEQAVGEGCPKGDAPHPPCPAPTAASSDPQEPVTA